MFSKKYNQLVDLFLDSNQLGHFDEDNNLICLYDIENNPKIISKIKTEIEKITKKYKLVILDKNDVYTSINILDIEV